MGHRHRPGPLAVVPSVARAARTQVAGSEVGAGASVQTGLPQAFVDVFARTAHEVTPWATAGRNVISTANYKNKREKGRKYKQKRTIEEIHANFFYSRGICIILRPKANIKFLYSRIMLLYDFICMLLRVSSVYFT